jgi:CBS domain-containing protein
MGIVSTALSFGAGYVVGAIKGTEPLRAVPDRARQMLSERVSGRASSGVSSVNTSPGVVADFRDIREVMTAAPITVPSDATLREAAQIMADNNIGDVFVVEPTSEGLLGILTDRDIAIRAVAKGLDPSTTDVGDVSTDDVGAIGPNDTVQDALRLMRDRAVRRLPVVESGKAIGVVTLGDLSVEADPDSVLADLSTAPPDR